MLHRWANPCKRLDATEMNDMPDDVFAGIFICSHNPDVIEEAKVWNVRIDRPVMTGYNPDKEG